MACLPVGPSSSAQCDVESLVAPFAVLIDPGVTMTVTDAEGSFVREFTSKESLVVGLPTRCRVSATASGGEGTLVIAYLDPEAPRLRPLDALRLVDRGFRIPYVDPGGAVQKEREARSGRPPERNGPGDELGNGSSVAVMSESTQGKVACEALPSEDELWAARLVNSSGSDLLQPLSGRDGVYHLVQDQEAVDRILREELPPDEAAAIAAANAWLAGEPPVGRPYEMGADTSGYAIGGVTGQCVSEDGKMRILLYFSAHLSACQPNWHPLEQ